MTENVQDKLQQLNKKVIQLLDKHLYEEAMEPALKARDLALQYLSSDNITHINESADRWIAASSLKNLANLYEFIGKFAEAESLYQQVWNIDRRNMGEDNLVVATDISDLADLYQLMGRYVEAEPLYWHALNIYQRVLGKDLPGQTKIMNKIAILYQKMLRYDEAISLYNQALELIRRILGEDQLSYITVLSNLTAFYVKAGMFAEAEPLYHHILEFEYRVLGENHPNFAITVHHLAVLYSFMGRYAEAEQMYLQALEIGRQVFRNDDIDMSGFLNNLSVLYLWMGKYTEAEPLLLQALQIKSRILGEEHPDVALDLHSLVHLYAATDREAKAMSLIEKIISVDNRMIGQIFSASSEYDRMTYLKDKDEILGMYFSLVLRQPSKKVIQKALDILLRRKALTTEALVTQRDAILRDKYPELKQQLNILNALRMQIAQKTLAGREQEGIEAHKKILAEWDFRKKQLEAEIARKIPEMDLEKRLRQVDRQVIAQALPEGSVLVEFVYFNTFNYKAVQALKQLQWDLPRYIAFVMANGDSDNVQMIDMGEAKPIDELIAAFRSSITGEARSDHSEVLISAKSGYSFPHKDGNELRNTLFDPLLESIKGYNRLFISPDGELNRLPFETLPTGDGRRLIDEYHISYLGTGRDLLRFMRPLTKQPADPLVIADPDFDLKGGTFAYGYQKDQKQTANSPNNQKRGFFHRLFKIRGIDSGNHAQKDLIPSPSLSAHFLFSRYSRDLDRTLLYFNRLKGTRKEGKQIGSMLKVEPWLQKTALDGRIKAYRSPRILHIATHGFFLPDQKRNTNQEIQNLSISDFKGLTDIGRFRLSSLENPLLRSGLALAGVNTWLQGGTLSANAEDGLLTAEDVMSIDLLDTELVVLSACETGLGEIQTGEGVFGLRRSFVIAGARTLVMSLWKVPDKQTQELMSEFYRRLLNGEPRVEALRSAQLSMKIKYPDPYFWGAFICQGDPAPLSLLVEE